MWFEAKQENKPKNWIDTVKMMALHNERKLETQKLKRKCKKWKQNNKNDNIKKRKGAGKRKTQKKHWIKKMQTHKKERKRVEASSNGDANRKENDSSEIW
jgi:hypothetical protein